MSYKIELTDARRTIEIESDIYIDPEDPRLARALVRLAAFNVIAPLTELKVTRVALTPAEHEYKFKSKDARNWKQNIFTSVGVEASFTFAVTNQFARSEVTGNLLVLDSVVALVDAFQIVKIECKYL